ncbi:nuclear transcription factor Y subunit beta [Bactrocera neohumeralis]|uniref:nuclear transcription factor Y subunit beta n=1 Tax=Bactrocera neohumeralis TaxID=98809 RepID=UPI002165CB08|nr:nuclear transcription factor Y subunit beta [Bactrocera neohumeralis]
MNYQKGIKDPNLERHTKGKTRHFTVNGFNTHAQQQQQQQQVQLQSQSDVRNIYNNPYTPPTAPTTTLSQQQQQTHRLQQQQQQQQLLYKSIASGVVGNSGTNQYDYPPTPASEHQHQLQQQQQQLQQQLQLQQQQQQQQQLSNVLEADNNTFTSHNKDCQSTVVEYGVSK